ncbi:amino acid adenylation domain-containing protein, partial [Gordonia sp. (in: high G+C Gram-positive bacteria)]|uniref:amino acid adenylation domain-containing protein n=1 Tax=Gordonia sp. (in: high G+C Gram-positive bacteria) TaxID=84139 RepID=UPI003C7825AA
VSGPAFDSAPSGAMAAQAALTINVGVEQTGGRRRLVASLIAPEAVLPETELRALGDRWAAELATIAARTDADEPIGLSPSDVSGVAVTQRDLDLLADRYRGADVWRLAPLQRGFAFQAELAEAGDDIVDVYVAQAAVTLRGDVDLPRLRQAAQSLLDRHRVLRSGFVRTRSGEMVAVVPPHLPVVWDEIDATDAAAGDVADLTQTVLDEQRVLPFDLAAPPLLRFVAVRTATDVRLVMTSHHILIDGWSSPLLMADLLALYATGDTYTGRAADAGADFADFLNHIGTVDDAAGLAAWRELLAPLDGPTLVAADAESTAQSLPRDHVFVLDTETAAQIDDLARVHGVTVSTVMQFVWAVLLSKLTGNRVVAFGETVSGRPAELAGIDTMIGLFINTLPAVVDVDPEATIAEALAKLQAARITVLDHQHVGLPEITAQTGTAVLFDTLTVHESYPVDTESLATVDATAVGGLTVADVIARDATHYPLTMVTAPTAAGLEVKLKYLPSVFGQTQVDGFAHILRRIVDAVLHRTEEPVAAIEIADADAYRRAVVAPITATANSGRTIVDRFADTVGSHGQAPAVTAGADTLVYADLDARASAVAAALQARGVRPGDLVGIATDRTVDLMTAIVGVLKTGAGYLPLDLSNPVDRLAYIVDDARPTVVVVDRTGADHDLWAATAGHGLAVDVQDLIADGIERQYEKPSFSADTRAYVIYTSGSTGHPKGVEVTHRDVVTLMDSAAGDFDFRTDDVWTMFHSYAFDFSVWEMWGPLLSGGRLVVVDRDLARDPVAFAALLADEQVTVLSQTPSAFYQLAEARRRRELPLHLRYIVFGGEELSFEQARRWFDDHPAEPTRLVNMYGITETTVHVSFRELDPESVRAADPSFIGRPLASLGIHLLDDRLRPVPAGVVGEMYVTGGQLAQGYLRRPDLTATRFVANPYDPAGSRMYRTGDLARRIDGDIEYLGRGDAQVQLRGFRIEYGEIEAALLAADGVTAAAARVVELGARGQQLIGYVVTDRADLDPRQVRAAAAAAVPGYMVPDHVVEVAQLPLTANGKLDRKALPVPDVEHDAGVLVALEGEREHAVAAVFAEVLGAEQVGATDSFFDLGGNSLSATRLAARLSDALDADVSVRTVFAAPTVRELAAAVPAAGERLRPVTAVVPRPERIPLSFAQQRMWFINRFEPDSPVYNVPAVLRLSGELDADALRAAVGDLVGRHEILRTVFPAVDGQPHQLVGDAAEFAARGIWQTVDSQAALAETVMAGFDVTTQWPLRVRLYSPSADEHVLAVVSHHIAADGESTLPLITDLMTAYLARTAGAAPQFAPLEVQFADYALWQHEVLGSPDDADSVVGRQLDYWRTQLAGLPDVVDLPADRPRAGAASHRGRTVGFEIPAPVAAGVGELARRAGATEFMVVHAALAVLLSRLSAVDDIAIGTPIAGRGQAALDPLIGMFVNTLVLRTPIDAGESFSDLLGRVRAIDLDAFAHADVPFETVVDAVDPVRSEAFAPLTQVILSFDPGASATAADLAVAGLTVTPVEPDEMPAQLDLYVTVSTAQAGEPWTGSVVFETDLFDAGTVEAMMARLVDLLAALSAAPSTPVGDPALLAAAELSALDAVEWGREVTLAPETVADVVVAQAARTPDATALWFEGREVSYAEFTARAATLARELIAAGVGPESAVAVCVPRSVEMMVAVHGAVIAGGGYVPVDLGTPADRVEYMFATAAVDVLLVSATTADSAAAQAAAASGITVVTVDASGEAPQGVAAVTDAERRSPLRPDHPVYTLFTSGSTGRPKGVTLTHEAVVNRLWWGLDELPIDGTDVVVQKTPYTFDCSVPELFAPLMVGAELVVLRDGGHTDPLYVAQVIEQTRATMVHFVPSMMSVFTELVGRERIAGMDHLRIISTTGEALPPALAGQIRSWLPDILFYNLYGPTEAAVEITYQRIDHVGDDDLTVPIGVPVWNSSALVLDSRLQRVPAGVPGELYLGGVQLARGYASRGDLTADRFIADPFGEPGARLYRSGDLVRRLPDGGIEYLGRTDFQVKLRGQRIELGEIESVLAGAPGVVHAAATVADGPGGSQHLVGYLAGRPGESLDLAAVKAAAADALPGYMVPTVWTVLEDIALNTAGKLDRKALPAPDFESVAAEFVAPTGAAESRLAEVFATVLGVERVSVTESFFDLGGNSLSAMRLAARAGEALGVEVSVRELFEAPSVRELADAVAGNAAALAPIVAAVPRPERIPLTFAQQRMWFINQFDPGDATYNIPAILELTGDLDVAALRAATVDVVVRHEVLRTTFPAIDGEPVQLVGTADAVAARLDWAQVSSWDEFVAAASAGFDVAVQEPLRVRLLAKGADRHVIAVIAHHIATDGESMLPLVTDLVTAYDARVRGAAPEFEPLEVQVADYAIWQHAVLGSATDADSVVGRQLAFWRGQLDGLPDVLDLPADRPRPTVASHRGASVDFPIPADVATGVEAVAERFGVTPFMVVHAGLSVLLARLSATGDIAVSTPVAGRGQAALDRLVGMFVNTLVLRAQVDSGMSFADLLSQVRESDLEAFAHADAPFESVVEALDPVRSEAFSPLAQVMLSFDPAASVTDASISVAGLDVTPVAPPVLPAQVDLSVIVSSAPAGQAWAGSVIFATDLFDESTVAGLADRLVAVLASLTADPDLAVGDAAFLDETERARALAASAGPAGSAELPTVADLLTRRVARTPDAEALRLADRRVSYAEFGARVNLLARELIAAGVGPDVAVAVAIDRSVELMVAVHAVIAAGGQYVPLDPDAPADRMAYMLATADVQIVLTAAAVPPAAVSAGVRVLTVDAAGPADLTVPAVTDADRVGPISQAHAAYTLFTSGSTGQPKGVTVTHGALGNLLGWFDELVGDLDDPSIMLKTPLTFDVSLPELFWPVLRGARTVIAEPGGHRDPAYLRTLIAQTQVSIVQFVPSMLSVFFDELGGDDSALAGVERVYIAGEALTPAVADKVFAAVPHAQALNLYGPTEDTVYATVAELRPGAASVSIGRPVAGTAALVLDDRLHPVPVGVPGELYLAGVQLARGYAARTDLTAERFVADPFGAPGSRLYRTGDLVRWNGDGEIDYLGRTDFQVKLRGQRVELGEVEAAVAGVPGVVKAAATVVAAPGGAEHLVAYVSPATVDVEHAKRVLAQKLPSYMVPTVWVPLDDLVLNTAGKIDRRALPAPDFGALATAYVAPENPTEQVLAEVFAELLGLDRVSVADSFFDLGGNSLSAMRLAARAGEALGVEVSVRDVFEATSVRDLIARTRDHAAALAPVTAVTPRPDLVPLSFAQQRLWFLNRLDPDNATYNVPIVLRLTGSLDVPAMRAAISDLIGRHEVLRTTFPDVDGTPHQLIHPAADIADALSWTEVSSLDEIAADVARSFDLTTQWPLRVLLWRRSADEHLLAVIGHHIAMDGESFKPLVTDVITAYAARCAGRAPEYRPLQVQFADFALWQQTELGSADDPESVVGKQLAYWSQQLEGLPGLLEFPTDRPRPAVASNRGDHLERPLAAETAAGLRRLAGDRNATPFMVVHAAFAAVMGRLSNATDVAISTPVAGRGQAVLDPLVGMFVNTLVLRATVDGGSTFDALVRQVADTDVAAFGNADVPFEAVVDAVKPIRSEAFAPLAQVSLNFDPGAGASDGIEVAGLGITPVDPGITSAQVDLYLTVRTAADGDDWTLDLAYATDLFDADTVRRLLDTLADVLAQTVADPDILIGDLQILDDAQERELDRFEHGPIVEFDERLLTEVIAEQVSVSPEAVALVFGEREVSYRE